MRKRFRRPACSAIGQLELMGQMCVRSLTNQVPCAFKPIYVSPFLSKITVGTHPKLAKRNHTKTVVSLIIYRLPEGRYAYLGGILKEGPRCVV